MHFLIIFFSYFTHPLDAPSEKDDDRPNILWSLFFTQQDVTEIPDDALREGLPGNVHLTSGAGQSIGFDHAVAQVRISFLMLIVDKWIEENYWYHCKVKN